MQRTVIVILTVFAMLTLAVSPALACGPYGDPVALAEMDVSWTATWVDTSRSDLKQALASGDAAAVDDALATFESAVAALALAESRLAELEQRALDDVSLASSAAP